jgi:hypothetical protein
MRFTITLAAQCKIAPWLIKSTIISNLKIFISALASYLPTVATTTDSSSEEGTSRLSMGRLPRIFITVCVAHPQPTGFPQMAVRRMLNNPLEHEDIKA